MTSPPSHLFFVTGGTVPAGSPSYVGRRADSELFDALRRGEFCYILTSRQMGKSSLMVRTTEQLRALGIQVAVLDLTAIGQNLTPDQWYNGLALRLGRQLNLEDEIDDFWLNHERLGPCQRFFTALSDIVLPQLKLRPASPAPPKNTPFQPGTDVIPRPAPLVIFIDELDVVRSLPFRTDEFFAALRECFTRRLENPEFHRLSFCLLGVATPTQLIQDVNTTPFNIGRRIELRDFTPAEATGLVTGLTHAGAPPDLAATALDRILFWTHGHPYLTQRLCRSLQESLKSPTPSALESSIQLASLLNPKTPIQDVPACVDATCTRLFLAERARGKDDNLAHVRDRLLRSDSEKSDLLALYQRVRRGERIPDNEADPLVNALLLSGIVRLEAGFLTVRNRIYQEVFDDDWIRTQLPAPATLERSVAVLPFQNRNASEDDEYLGDGIAEDLIIALSKVPGLKVAARTSSFALRGPAHDIRQIASKLGVAHVVDGSIRRSGSQLRIVVQLVQASDGSPVWTEKFDREWSEVFAVQDEITRSITQALKLKLLGETDFKRRSHANTDAYQAYLRGRYHLHRGSSDGLTKAIQHFEQAITIDPQYADPHAGIAEALLHQYFWNTAVGRATLDRAKESALHALLLDEHLPEAHIALALACGISDWNWDAEDRHLKRATELNPNAATAHTYRAMLLAMRLRPEDSIASARRGVEIDPLSPFVQHHLAVAHFFAGQYAEAEAAITRTLDLEPNFFRSHVLLSNLCQETGRFDQAITAASKAAEIAPGPLPIATLGAAYARAGQTQQAHQTLQRLADLAKDRPVAATMTARIHAGLGQWDQAMADLERAYDDHSGDLDLVHLYPIFKPLRSHPRFQALLQRLRLPATTDAAHPPAPAPSLPIATAAPTQITLAPLAAPTREPPAVHRPISRRTSLLFAVIALLLAVSIGWYIRNEIRETLNSVQPPQPANPADDLRRIKEAQPNPAPQNPPR